MSEFRYKAFISYSHQDESWARWLHGQLEGFQPPADLASAGRLSPVFRDTEELAASRDLSRAIQSALAASENLVVICSPAAAVSSWVEAEIERFIELGRDDFIFCLVVDGAAGDPTTECMPRPLREREPLAADVRNTGRVKSNELLRLIAALLRVDFNDLRRREASIAVLPFRDLSAFGDQEYLSDGFAEELLNALARLPDLRVISRNSSFQFKGSDRPSSEIGRELDAVYVAEGSIRTMGNALRVSVRLIDSRIDDTRWSKTYDRDLSALFALQDEIADDVASELHQTLTQQTEARKVAAEAYQLFLRSRHLARQFTREGLMRSNELLLEALTIEPDYLDALNGLSANYCTQVGEGFAPMEMLDESRRVLQRVLTIDEDNADALAGLAWHALRFDSDLATAADCLGRALAGGMNNCHVLNSAGGLLTRLRRLEEAIVVAGRVARLDPLNSHAYANLGVYSLFAGRLDDAIDAYHRALEISPGFTGAHFAIGLALIEKGELQPALAAMERESDDEFRCKGTALACWSLGDREAFQTRLDQLIESWGDMWPSEVAEVYAHAGMVDLAFEWIDRDAADETGAGWAESVLNPVFRKLHGDPRWQSFLTRLGLAPAQLARIPFTLPDALYIAG